LVWFASSVKFLIPFTWLVAFGARLSPHSTTITPAHLSVYADLYDSGNAVANTISDLPLAIVPKTLGATGWFDHAALALTIWAVGTLFVLALWLMRGV
jgi:hypothetical protein